MTEKDTYTINDIKQLLKEYNRDKYGGYDRNYYVNIYIQGMPLTYLLHEKDFYTPEEIDKAWYAYPNTLTYAREDFYLGAYREDYFISSASSDKTIIKKFVYKVKEDFRIFIYLIERNKPEIKVSFGPKSESKKIEVEEPKDTQVDFNLPCTPSNPGTTLTEDFPQHSINFRYNLKFDFNRLFDKPYSTIFIKKPLSDDGFETIESHVYAIIPSKDYILATSGEEKYKYSDYGVTWAFTREELLKKE